MKGRNSTVISIRIPDSVYTIIKDRVNGQSVSEYIKDLIIHSVNTLKEEALDPIHNPSKYLPLDPTPKQEKLASLRQLITMSEATGLKSRGIEAPVSSKPPLYNKRLHRPGDKVIKDSKEVIVQEVDGDGNVILEL